jgi:aryl-phospho-beta-D-glucosidase BglC (GH1 family)
MMTRNVSVVFALLLAGASASHSDSWAFVKAQGRGVNLGNMLEAPSEGAWSVRLVPGDLALIASKGFQNVRIPIRWDGTGAGGASFPRVARTEPYTVDPRFFARVDSAIEWARRNRLVVVINDHHDDSLFQGYEKWKPRFLAMWRQIAERYRGLPTDSVAFEILNEPNGQVTVEAWNELLDTTLKVIRESNPTRPVVVGTANWGGLSGLSGLRLPANDSNLVLTLHYYEPFAFTHQGADWVTPVPAVGVPWEGTRYEKLSIRQAMDAIAEYAKPRNLPVFIGEFGAYSAADMVSRARWTRYCARLFESYGFSWAYWEFKAGFGIYDENEKAWQDSLVDALVSSDTSILKLGDPPEGGVDLVVNGGFASRTRWVLNGSQGASDFVVESSAGRIDILEPATDAWGIQLIQSPLVVVKGQTHVLQFDAWASSPRSIDGSVGMSKSPWTGYVSASAGLGTKRKTFFASFVPAATDSSARIAFNLGPDTGTVWLDSVRLLTWPGVTKVGPRRADPATSVIRVEGSRLVAAGPQRPGYTRLTSHDGRVVQTLEWVWAGDRWQAALRGEPRARLAVLQGRGATSRPVLLR